MLVTHPKPASPPSPGTDGHGRMVSSQRRGCVGQGDLVLFLEEAAAGGPGPSMHRDPAFQGFGTCVNPENTDGLDW